MINCYQKSRISSLVKRSEGLSIFSAHSGARKLTPSAHFARARLRHRKCPSQTKYEKHEISEKCFICIKRLFCCCNRRSVKKGDSQDYETLISLRRLGYNPKLSCKLAWLTSANCNSEVLQGGICAQRYLCFIMLLCDVANLEPGMIVGGSIPHPKRPTTELLRPGAELDANMIEHLTRLGVSEVWVAHDATSDLDAAVASGLSTARLTVYNQLKTDFSRLSISTVSGAKLQVYRQAVTDLVFELISSGQYAHLSHQMVSDSSGIFTHCANVAFLSVLVGLEMETYLVSQRPRLKPEHARDVVPLGLGAMLHDIGKTTMESEDRAQHEISIEHSEEDEIDNYRKHVFAGHELLDFARFPATARHAVLNHHQRFDGSGWPIQVSRRQGNEVKPQRGTEIHIFSRIISAANVLDNLLNDPSRPNTPPVAALRDFNSSRFDGWFDPVVRYLMVRRLPPFPIGSLVRLSNNAQATIVALNFRQPCRPVVRMLDENIRNNKGELSTIDLELEPALHIVESAGRNIQKYLFELPDLRTTVHKEKASSYV